MVDIERAIKYKHSRAVAEYLKDNRNFLKQNCDLYIPAIKVFSKSYGHNLSIDQEALVIQADVMRLLELILLKVFTFHDMKHLDEQGINDIKKYVLIGVNTLDKKLVPSTNVERHVCRLLKRDVSFFNKAKKFVLVENIINS